MEQFNWEEFKRYVNTYDPKEHGGGRNECIINDMLYGLGLNLDENLFKNKTGYERFKNYLIRFVLLKNMRFKFKHFKERKKWVEQQVT